MTDTLRRAPTGDRPSPDPAPPVRTGSATGPVGALADSAARLALLRLLARLESGHLELAEDGGAPTTFGAGRADGHRRTPLQAEVRIHDRRTYRAVLTGGSVGLGASYLRGWWDTDDLTALLRLLSREVQRWEPARQAVSRPLGAVTRRLRAPRRPDKQRDRANIAAHYDLGNDFFSLMLDESMQYSSAIFARPDQSLAEASTHKLDLLCRRLGLGPDDHVVEIGTGWGGFALHAASRYGCRVTTTTISRAQFTHATARVAEAGLAHLVEVRNDDYRDLTGTYDKLVSVEMIEAVDWRELDTFFATCQRLLVPGGVVGLQAIVIADQRYERAKNSEDFIKAFIFPGGCLPSIGSIVASTGRVTDFTLTELDAYGRHYAETLRRWRANLAAHEAELAALELDQSFRRMWEFYLAYCEAAFDEGLTDVVQAVLARPGASQRAG